MNKQKHFIIFLFLFVASIFVLSGCNEENSESPQDCAHQWIEADCLYPKTCRICQETEEVALGHNFIDATCTEPKTCIRCNLKEGNAHGHTEVIDKALAASCTSTGLTEGKHCSVCNEILVAQQSIQSLGHNWKNPTCETPKLCSICSTVDPDSKPLGHSYVNDICKNCGEIAIALQQMSALGIANMYDEVKADASLELKSVTYDYKVNNYGDSIIRMVICFEAFLGNDSTYIYATILCCKYEAEYYDCIDYEWNEYETKYIDDEWNGLYFHTKVSDINPGICNIILDNESAMEAHKDLINNSRPSNPTFPTPPTPPLPE